MTKLFNSLEEVNTFLKGGKRIDHIELQAGMVAVSVMENGNTEKATETTSNSVQDVIDRLERNGVFDVNTRSGLLINGDKKGEFALALASLPENDQVRLLRTLIATASPEFTYTGKKYFQAVLDDVLEK